MTKEEIFEKIKNILVTKFEIAEDDIKLESNMAEEFDLDSIDFIDLVVDMKNWIPGKINPDIFKTVKTVQDVVDTLYPYTQGQAQ
ncbi:MAG: acyl carrier protein [Treponema sp.]|nr:acyl carrier protein [Treponema sp.]